MTFVNPCRDVTVRASLASIAGRRRHPVFLGGLPGSSQLHLLGDGVELGRDYAAASRASARIDLPDGTVSRRHARVQPSATGGLALLDLGSTNGTTLDGVRIVGPQPLKEGAVIGIGAHVFVFRHATDDELDALREDERRPLGPLVTRSPVLATVKLRLRLLATSPLDLLLTGETGVGKEVFAKAIHGASDRTGPFVAINCAAMPEALAESELFGYERGAHSTASTRKPGLLRRADGGTLLLDELGEMPSSVQAKLLRFLQTRTLTPLGGTEPVAINARIIAATNCATDETSPLRLDLRARLGAQAYEIPPLRARIEDLGALAAALLGDLRRTLRPDALLALSLYSWPGNVRELEQVLGLARLLSDDVIGLEHLPPHITRSGGARPAPESARRTAATAGPTREQLESLLSEHGGAVPQVARALGRQRTLVWRWLRKHELDPRRFQQRPAPR